MIVHFDALLQRYHTHKLLDILYVSKFYPLLDKMWFHQTSGVHLKQTVLSRQPKLAMWLTIIKFGFDMKAQLVLKVAVYLLAASCLLIPPNISTCNHIK